MTEKMTFLPREQILSLEEILKVAEALVGLGINKLRLTGGEPLVRQNIVWLVDNLNKIPGIKEVSMTSNGSQLSKLAKPLADAGLARINISLDSLQEDKFRDITRTGNLHQVLEGIDAAKQAGFNRIKLNSVILKGRNDNEILALASYAMENDLDIAFIEEMPLGAITEHNRALSFCSSEAVKEILSSRYQLTDSSKKTNGPSRYMEVSGYNSLVGFISPHSNNFCSTCNRIRITSEGRLLLCLGNENSVDLRAAIRDQHADQSMLANIIRQALGNKPEKHHFDLNDEPDIVRFMNMTGG
jgi:cyclic pyranopterin phosphate synthase